ncbi:hypothetical protein PoB_002510800 [Plakobranchus ocellatus]|uniref:Uncharacterized protein n=1 Tax=Plakobranchus ocellatus TaxID=259542 RepID=A0AAV3ZVY1_9GAST|nr:hypothetical protein PoB_002510800 [Plakobranchus ocellatus]
MKGNNCGVTDQISTILKCFYMRCLHNDSSAQTLCPDEFFLQKQDEHRHHAPSSPCGFFVPRAKSNEVPSRRDTVNWPAGVLHTSAVIGSSKGDISPAGNYRANVRWAS